MNVTVVKSVLLIATSLMLSSCAQSQGDSSPVAKTGFVQTYTAAATAGEVLTYTLDTQNLTYTYEIVHSAYNLTGSTGSGTLVPNSDGSYSPAGDPSAKVYAVQNGLLVGTVRLTLNGVQHEVPIYGMANPITSSSGIADVYNYVGIQCPTQTFGIYSGCTSSYGTVQVDSTGSYMVCPNGNLMNGTPSCTSPTSGTHSSTGNGIWQAVRTGSTDTSYLMAFLAPNGQKVALMDLTDPSGFGYGYIVMSTQAPYDATSIEGTWLFESNAGDVGTLTVYGPQINTSLGYTYTASYDSPWNGLVSVANGVALLAGTGAYAFVTPSVQGYLELGMRK